MTRIPSTRATGGLIFALGSLAVASAFAQDGSGGEGGLEYGLATELRYDDNIFRSRTDEVDSTILEVAPFARASLYNKGNTYQVLYRVNHAEYFDSSEDTYTDHSLELDINQRFTERQAIAVKAGYEILTEQRGTGFSEQPNPLVDGPDDYTHANLGLRYFLGKPGADLRFEIFAQRDILDFDSSYVGDTRDYESDLYGGLARYRVGAKTDLLLELRRQEISYDNQPLTGNGQPINLDSEEDYYLVGLAWELTAKTRGEVRVGHSARDYDAGDVSTSDFHWEAKLEWLPKTYSRFTLNTARESLETYRDGFFINTRRYELKWNHDWAGRLQSELTGGIIADTYEESARDDDQNFLQAELGYNFAPWLDFSLGYRYWENDSTVDLIDYTQNILYLRAAIEL